MTYINVIIPKDKKPNEYTAQERRAEILKLIIQAGSPKTLSRTELAERYSLSISQVSQDFKAIAKECEKLIGKDAKYRTSIIYEKYLGMASKAKTLIEAEKGLKLLDGWNNWLFNIGKQKKVAEKIIIDDGPKRRSAAELYEEILERRKKEKEDRKKKK